MLGTQVSPGTQAQLTVHNHSPLNSDVHGGRTKAHAYNEAANDGGVLAQTQGVVMTCQMKSMNASDSG